MIRIFVQRLLLLLIFFGNFSCLSAKAHWLDLPRDPLEKIGGLGSPLPLINQLIDEYHSIKKPDSSMLALRICYLKEIVDLLSKHIEKESNPRARKFLTNVRRTAEEKGEYLRELENMRRNFIVNPHHIENYAHDLVKLKTNRNPLFLVNERKYDSKLRIYWGEYFLEVIDPCHRFLTSYYDLWLETNPLDKDYFSFFVWLEGQSVNFELTVVRYFTDAEKDQCEVTVRDGKFVKKMTGEVLTCCQEEQEYLFIIGLDERIYIVPGSKEVRHTSLSHGKPVLAIGNINIREGVTYKLGLESGHYQPTPSDGQQLLGMLLDREVTLSLDTVLDFYQDGEKQSLSLADFVKNLY